MLKVLKKKNWMQELSLYYERIRNSCPDDKLMILFDIDGTILDMRFMIFYVLKLFDKTHGTDFFKTLKVSDIVVHENQIENLLDQFQVQQQMKEKIIKWYVKYRWTSTAILESHRPFVGVMDVIRWFQMQPNTYVGLNTGRPESIRRDTIRSLNELGKEYKVIFTDDLLYMNPYGWEKNVTNSKASGVRHFQNGGYHVFAFIDNEPENLEAVSKSDLSKEILLLHANTIYESKRKKLPSNSVRGIKYDITDLIHEESLPRHVKFVWHGVNDKANLRQFIASNVQWAELDIRLGPSKERLILRHDSFKEMPMQEGEDFLYLEQVLEILDRTGKSIKFDLKENGSALDNLLKTLQTYNLDNSRLWFNGNTEVLKEDGFRKLVKAYPGAIIQCPIDFIYPIIFSIPEKARDTLDLFKGWGINRFSLSWQTPGMKGILDQIEEWGFESNIYNVPDLESFLKAVLLLPRSITADFNFPKWNYFGRGSGENMKHYEYAIRRSCQRVYSNI